MPLINTQPYGSGVAGPGPDINEQPGDPYFENVTLLCHMDGANNTTTFTDMKRHVMSRTNAYISNAQSRFGNASAFFDGAATTTISTPATADFNFGTGNFTIEAWVYYTALPTATGGWTATWQTWGVIWETGTLNASDGQQLRCNKTLIQFGTGDTTLISGAHDMVAGTWYHVAATRTGNTMRLFVNGVVKATATVSGNIPTTLGANVFIGNETGQGGTHTGYIDEVRVTKGVSRYTDAFSPPTLPFPNSVQDPFLSNVTLLMHMEGAVGSTNFIDSSPTPKPIGLIGTAAMTSTQAKFGNVSASMGTGGITLANSVGAVGFADFTVEGWYYFTTNSIGYQPLFGNTGTGDSQGWIVILEANNTLTAYFASTGGSWSWSVGSTYTPPINQWIHIAVSRATGTTRLFANGVLVGTSTVNGVHLPNGTFRIGNYPFFPGGGKSFTGYIDEFRITLGTGRYTTAFTPTTGPFVDYSPIVETDQYLSKVSLLMHGDGVQNGTTFIDEMRHAISRGGTTVTSTDTSKFGVSSLKFNGTSDSLTAVSGPEFAFGTGDFTIEMWINPTSRVNGDVFGTSAVSGNNGLRISLSASGSIAVNTAQTALLVSTSLYTANVWTHIAVSRNAGTMRMFINGVLDASVASSTNFSNNNCIIGRAFNSTLWYAGYIDDLRVTKGVARYTSSFDVRTTALPDTAPSDPFYSNVTLLMHMNGVNGGTVITDQKGAVVTRVGSPVTSNAQLTFGPSSLSIPSGSYLSIANSSRANSLPGDFTVEMWVYPTVLGGTLIGNFAWSGGYKGGWRITAGGSGEMSFVPQNGTNYTSSTGAFPINTWTHLAVSRAGNTLRIFANGVQVFSTTTAISVAQPSITDVLYIGAAVLDGGAQQFWVGFIDDLRISNFCRYTANFSVPSAQYPDY